MLRPLILAGLAVLGLAAPAAALPLARPDAPDAPVVRVYAGCGPYGHRGPYGGCRPGGQAGGYIPGRACPPGWHIRPYGRRCWRDAGFYRPHLHRTFGHGDRRFGWHGGYHRSGLHRGGGYRRSGWHGGRHRRFAWHGGRRGGGFRRVGWHHGGFHRGGFRHRR